MLKQIMRQQKNFESIRQFRDTLFQLRNDFISFENWQFLLIRAKNFFFAKIWQKFDNALRLYFRNEKMRKYNWARFLKFGKFVIKIEAKNVDKSAKKASWNDAERLNQKLLFFQKIRMMLTWNKWTSENLINDVMNILYNLIWNENVQNSFIIMFVITLIKMNDYKNFDNINVNEMHVIFIIFIYHQWIIDDVVCIKIQFFFTLTFAITMHKN